MGCLGCSVADGLVKLDKVSKLLFSSSGWWTATQVLQRHGLAHDRSTQLGTRMGRLLAPKAFVWSSLVKRDGPEDG